MTKQMFKKAGQRFWCILIFFKEEREAESLKEDIPELKANGGTTTFWDSEEFRNGGVDMSVGC